MVINNSKKISEIRATNILTEHPEYSWIPLAQYNSRTDSYTNLSMNVDAIISYLLSQTKTLVTYYHLPEWKKFWGITSYEINGDITDVHLRTDKDEIASYIINNPLSNALTSYTSAYTIQAIDYFSWAGYPNIELNIVRPSNVIPDNDWNDSYFTYDAYNNINTYNEYYE